jgi:AcrR family transcriptional regulator
MAWGLCREEGLAALSLRELGRRVGLQAPSLYFYFDSKNSIYDAMFAQGCRELVGAQPEPPDDPLEGVRAIMRYFVEFCTADPVRHQLLFQRTIPGFEPSPASFEVAVKSISSLSDWFARVGLDGPESVDLFTAVGSGIAAQQNANEPGGDRWTRLIDSAALMFVEHIRRQRASTPPRSSSPSIPTKERSRE